MAFKSSVGTTPYQPVPSIQPKYGFRYSGSAFAPAMSPANIAPVNYDIPSYEAPVTPPTPYVDNTPITMSDNGNDNQSSMASVQMSMDAAPKDAPTYSPSFNPTGLIPGLGLAQTLSAPAVPTSGYGSPGSVSGLTGGVFDEKGRSVDPITGVANPEFATSKAFTDYMLEDPLGNTFGDKDNTFTKSSDPSAGTGAYQQAIQNSNKEGSANYGMGTLSNQDKIMVKVGMDSGIPEHSLVNTRIEDDGTKTTLGTTKQGAQIKGQDLHLPTYGSIEGVDYGSSVAHGMDANPGDKQGGVYSTTGNQDTGSTVGTKSATATVGEKGAYSSFADDAQASGSGTGGGKG